MTPDSAAVVLDHTALLLLGRGDRFLSGLVAGPARRVPGRYVYVPALCLAAAVAERPIIGEHALALPSLEIVPLGETDAISVGALITENVPWQYGHAVTTCRPDPEWPTGRPVLTSNPRPYERRGVDVIPLG
jgi:hypothetical protein